MLQMGEVAGVEERLFGVLSSQTECEHPEMLTAVVPQYRGRVDVSDLVRVDSKSQ